VSRTADIKARGAAACRMRYTAPALFFRKSPMSRFSLHEFTTIEIQKEDIKFSAAHFTIFSATERERLHGHNFHVQLAITVPLGDNGMRFSYKEVKDRLRALVATLDEYVLLPALSPFLKIDEDGNNYRVNFNDEILYFLKADTQLLPVRNTTVEEFARYLLQQFLQDTDFIAGNAVQQLVMKVSSGAGQWGSAQWSTASETHQ
jgi:6-pyruvoyltetrahydropterin/6-carboxytetrahydropterin synthase